MAVLGLLAFGAGFGAVPARAECASGGTRGVFDYPVVLKGPPQLEGARTDGVAAYALREGVFSEIPVQIEEVNGRGDYVLAEGMPFTRATDDGHFVGNDELVLDGAELGEDIPNEALAPKAMGPNGRTWKLSLCRGGIFVGAAWIVDHGVRRPSPFLPAVVFDRGRAEILSSLYRYKFQPSRPALLGEVLIKRDGVERPVLQDSRFRMPLRTPFFMPDLMFDEDDFSSEIESWQSGPLRSIVAVGVKYSAFLSLFKLHLFSELVFYRNRFVIPTLIEFVFDPSSVLKAGSGIAYSLKFPEGRAWKVDANLELLPAQSPADVVASGKTAAATEVFVMRGSSPDGSFLAQVRVDPKARAMVPPPFMIRPPQFSSEAHRAHWPWLSDLPGDLGVYLDFSRVHAGRYDFGLDLLLSPKAEESFKDFGPVESSWRRRP